MKKTLFLDIDETLNSPEGYNELKSKSIVFKNISPEELKLNGYIDWINKNTFKRDYIKISDEDSLVALEHTVEKFEIDNIVISSSWRLDHSVDYIKFLFRIRGFKYWEIINNSTPSLESELDLLSFSEIRKREILEYVDKNNISEYYILDDIKCYINGHYLDNIKGWEKPLKSVEDLIILDLKDEK